MATTATPTPLLEPHATPSPSRPDRLFKQVVPEGVELKAGWDRVEGKAVTSISNDRAEPARLQSLSVSVDEHQQFVVQDVLGAVYGVGRQAETAFEDYFRSLAGRLALLRSRRGQLSAHLARQLDQLESLFPGR